jgi:hypothetical protein
MQLEYVIKDKSVLILVNALDNTRLISQLPVKMTFKNLKNKTRKENHSYTKNWLDLKNQLKKK